MIAPIELVGAVDVRLIFSYPLPTFEELFGDRLMVGQRPLKP